MKYLISWTPRDGGSAADQESAAKRSLQVFSKWAIPDGATFHQFVQRLDGNGGYAVVESDDYRAVMDGPLKFTPFFVFDVVPVVDIMDSIAVAADAIEFRDSIS